MPDISYKPCFFELRTFLKNIFYIASYEILFVITFIGGSHYSSELINRRSKTRLYTKPLLGVVVV